MIKKLRVKLVAVAMLSLLLVLSVIMVWLNVENYHAVVTRADSVLTMLRDHNGLFPSNRDSTDREQITRRYRFRQFPNDARFFHVRLDNDGEIASFTTAQIAEPEAIDGEAFVKEALAAQKDAGFVQQYRFIHYDLEDGAHFIFLDCSSALSNAQVFLQNSVVISAVGFFTVFLLLIFFSGRIIKPVSQSYEKQKRFITDAGHELKTPVTIIDADVELLEMDAPGNEWLLDIRHQTKRLSSLTHDLIYLSRLEEKETFPMIEFPLSEAVSECAASFQALAKTQNKKFFTEIEPMISYQGDENGILRLVNILLDNAVKYADDGGSVSLKLEKTGKKVKITVENTVDALDPDTLDNMFERFYRAPSSRAKQSGYGIGLSIAKAIVAAHKGKITAAAPGGKTLAVTVVLS